MEYVDLGRFVLVFLFILALIGAMALILRQPFMQKYMTGNIRKGMRLSIVETLHIDAKRKLVIIRRDEVEHLLLLSQSGDMTIETSIAVQPEHMGGKGEA